MLGGWIERLPGHSRRWTTRHRSSLHAATSLWLAGRAYGWQIDMWRTLLKLSIGLWWRPSTRATSKVLLLELRGQASRPVATKLHGAIANTQAMLVLWLSRRQRLW